MDLQVFLALLSLTYCLVIVQGIHRPVVGILMQKAVQNDNFQPNDTAEDNNHDYLVWANYVKALEGAGALTVPIMINQNMAYYRRIMSEINGLLIPGGSADLQDPTDIGPTGALLYKMAKEVNDKGVYFPVLGVCQGFQLLAWASSDKKLRLTPCKGLTNVGRSLKFLADPIETNLYREAPEEVMNILETEPVTANAHSFCVTRKSLREHGLSSTWRVMTLDQDDDGLWFVTSMEHTQYPIVGIQFHPEKILYDFAESFTYPTDHKAILANRWFYDWFVEQVKKNSNSFPDNTAFKHVMENYFPTLYYDKGTGMMEKYIFSREPKEMS